MKMRNGKLIVRMILVSSCNTFPFSNCLSKDVKGQKLVVFFLSRVLNCIIRFFLSFRLIGKKNSKVGQLNTVDSILKKFSFSQLTYIEKL